MQVTLTDGTTINCSDNPQHTGAEGELFLSTDNQSLVKLYWREDSNRRQSLDAIINQYNAIREHSYWRSLFCWPDGIVMHPRLGVRMPRAPGGLRDLNWFVLPKSRASLTPSERGSWLGHIGIAIRLSRSMRRLHQLGLSHADLSRNNCLVDPARGSLVLIDLDGLVVPGILPPRVVGTPEFMAPEIIAADAKPSIYTDLHALAVLLYQVLLFRHPLKGPKIYSNNAEEDDRLAFGERALFIEHPTDKSNRPRRPFVSTEILGNDLQQLFQRAFVEGLHHPASRPQAAHWEATLIRLADRQMQCFNEQCEAKSFPYLGTASPTCPWCHAAWHQTRQLALIDLYRPVSGRPGQYSQDNWQVVAQQGRTLYEWHVHPDRSPGPESSTTALAQLSYDKQNGQWMLANQSQCAMTTLSGNALKQTVPPGSQFALKNDLRVFLSEESNTRLAYIRTIDLQ